MWLPDYDRNFIRIRTTMTTDSRSMKPPVGEMPRTIDRPKKLSNQYEVKTRMMSSSKLTFLSGALDCLFAGLCGVGYLVQLLNRNFLAAVF